ncbi:hypothetical protein PR001_g26871 [Phytophthora rubi]|uniref:HAT C-terminal dimerisation domain-containing protein n=1 Tax=Phytophthora rubi TaxID=129364 RepID=A0A6A3HPD1_9STRA|nr:hypothetical protein PR001_g26871 [Phytophthora rubi]
MCAVYEERPPSFLTLCETRWNSMHGCFASLLRVKTALENLAHHYRNDKTLPAALKVFSDPNFWMDLAAAESVTYPLAQASLRLQSDDNTVADVTRSFYKIYKGFSTCLYEFQLMPSLEHRWKQCEQPLLLLGLGLHPKYVAMYRRLMKMAPDRCTSKDAHLISWRFFVESGLYYYHRLTGTPGGTLYGELSDWITGTSGYLVSTSALDSDLVPRFWNSVQLERPQSKLPELAIIILSIAVNTATCERYFSDLGVIHTPKRNGLKVPKVRQMAATRRFLREKFADYYNAKLKMKKPVNAAELRRRADPDSLDELTETSATDNGPGPEIQGNESSSLDSTEVDEIVEPEIAISSWLSVIGEMTSADEVNTAENGDTAVEVDEMDEITDASLEAVVSGQAQISGMSNNYRDEDDEIPEADRRPLPQENDPLFSQESILRGLRGRKTPLADLFENQQLDAEFLSQ